MDDQAELTQLTPSEQEERVELEAKIKLHEQAFDEAGNALIIIKDKRLYRSTHTTFERYCQERWDMTSRRANYLIGAAKVMVNLKVNNDGNSCSQILPVNEAQIRPLTSLTPEQQCEVWQKVVESASNGKLTANLVNKIAKQYCPSSPGKVLLSAKAKKVSDVISVLANYEIGQIREAILSFEGEQLGLPELARKVADKFSLLELAPKPELVGNAESSR